MEQLTPPLVLGRLPEALRMTLQGVPPDEQEVSVIGFDAAPEIVPLIARAGGDNLVGTEEGFFEGLGFTGTNVQDRDFEHHGRDDSPLYPGEAPHWRSMDRALGFR